MSRWGALQSAVVERLEGLRDVQTLATAATSDVAAMLSKAFPSVYVVWSSFDVVDPAQRVGPRPAPEGEVRIVIQVYCQSGSVPGGGEDQGFEILDQIRELLLGWTPPSLPGESQFPLMLRGEGLVDVQGSITVLQAEYILSQVIVGS